ncbi:MAG TPA: CehA/McbA family metallohydrolase [Conexibacter sp.]
MKSTSMRVVSPHFTSVALEGAFNARRAELSDALRTPASFVGRHGVQAIRGMPFDLGHPGRADVVLLDREPVAVELGGATATYVLFVHVVEDAVMGSTEGSADGTLAVTAREAAGTQLGALVSEYMLEYEDGSSASAPILRRFAIQQARYVWGSMPFACVAAAEDLVLPSAEEALALRCVPELPPTAAWYGQEVRGLPAGKLGIDVDRPDGGVVWIYALANAAPEKPLRRVTCRPREERSALYAVSLTDVVAHPLRPGVRRKLRVRLPEHVRPNATGGFDEIAIDLGTVIAARQALDYDHERWAGAEPVVEPERSQREVMVEYAAHPQARLHVGGEVYELGEDDDAVVTDAPARRPVRLRFLDGDSSVPVAVRLHLHGEAGEYLPPQGHHRTVQHAWTEHVHPELVAVENQYAYVDGECVADLPLGTVYVEISRGYEIAPLRTAVEVGPETGELTFALERVLRWRERGWVTADTHVHFLSPQTALLEGRAEGVNVVNLLASQWGELFSNVGDFDGKTTFGAEDLGGRGEFLVRVGSENRMQVLGHISLLGYRGELIQPLCTGGPDESAFGDPLEVTMAEWAQRCIDQGGLVVMPHAPLPQLERAADLVLGLVHAIELMNMNPLSPEFGALNPFGIADWYRYLNLGYHVPLVGGSDKMSAAMQLGGARTYARLDEARELTYEAWMDAVHAGNTFATLGPLASLRVEGVEPGGRLRQPAGGGSVAVEWEVESVRMPIERVEVVAGGLVADEAVVGGELAARGSATVRVPRSTWIALRVRASNHGRPDDLAAHTSAVLIDVDGSERFCETDAMAVLDQIQGALAYVDTIAPRPEARRFRELRATLETAYQRLHQRMHAAGIYHRHPLHDPGQPHEH